MNDISPLPEPEHDTAAAALARTLDADAESIEPGDRLADIRAQVGQPGRRRGLAAIAGVAAVAAVAAIAWAVADPPGGARRSTPPAVTSSDDPTSTPTSGQTPETSPSPSTSPASTAPGQGVAVPVYYLGKDGNRLALYREFHRVEVPANASSVSSLQMALDAATDPATVLDPDLSAPWQPRDGALAVTRSGAVVTIDLPLAEGDAHGRTVEQAKLAVQQLVWTATAVTQDAQLGVRVLIGGQPGKLFGVYDVGAVAHRATPAYMVLGSIWIESPAEGQSIASPVTIKGSACVYEATVAWQLLANGSVVRSGHTMASIGCPDRGTWSVSLGTLPAGSYVFRAYEPPASGEGPDRESTRSFTVR